MASLLHFQLGRRLLDRSAACLARQQYHGSRAISGPVVAGTVPDAPPISRAATVGLNGQQLHESYAKHCAEREARAREQAEREAAVQHIVQQLIQLKREYINYQTQQQTATQVLSTLRAVTTSPRHLKIELDPSELNPTVYYYQGLHDVASVLLLTVGEVVGLKVLSGLVSRHLRDYTRSNLDAVMQSQQLIPLLLQEHDAALAHHLRSVGIPPFFGISWQLTWFSHTLHDFATIQRLFDFFIASHPLMPLYVAVVNMRTQRERLLEVEDMPELHAELTKLPFPTDPRRVQKVLLKAVKLFQRAPPLAVARSARLSVASCSLFHAVCVRGLWHVPSIPQQLPMGAGAGLGLAQRLVQRYVDWLGLRPMMYNWAHLRSLQVGFAVSLVAVMVAKVDPERSAILMEQLKMVFGFR